MKGSFASKSGHKQVIAGGTSALKWLSLPPEIRLGDNMVTDADVVKRGWEAVARGDWDALIADYTDDMIFVMPGQNDILEGTAAFRNALENLGAVLPPGFDITSIRQIGDTGEVVSILEWKSDKVPGGSQLAVLFKLADGKVHEERWFVDTEQWKAAF